MKLTIVADDKFVSKDGIGIGGLTLKDFPSDVWAVQWNGSKGTVEKRDLSVTEITDITPYNAWITEYDTALATTIPSTDPVPPLTSTEANLRLVRNNMLEESDWSVLPDSQLSADKVTEWKTYRQALRDLPANTSDFSNPTYPTKPT